ncbi:MAG: hypothetical protein MRERV_11c070 [Mycoplasmataceae bacterium RV_VA103A]|nr:MAG: hypothetical protein MRERV_11c070 [Mycoplasmataceae bacterium RV_VA103A]
MPTTSPLLPCSRCHHLIQRKWNRTKKQWSPLNSVAFWANINDQSQLKNLKYQYLCRSCLVKWYEEDRENFFSTVPKQKRDYFYRYRYNGFFSVNDIIVNQPVNK